MPAAVGYASVLPDPLALPSPANDVLERRDRESVAQSSIRDPDASDARPERARRAGQFQRPRSRASDAETAQRRGNASPERPGNGRAPLGFGVPSSPFLTQLIAQQIIPEDAPPPTESADEGISAYQTVQRQSESFFGPLIPTEIRV